MLIYHIVISHRTRSKVQIKVLLGNHWKTRSREKLKYVQLFLWEGETGVSIFISKGQIARSLQDNHVKVTSNAWEPR